MAVAAAAGAGPPDATLIWRSRKRTPSMLSASTPIPAILKSVLGSPFAGGISPISIAVSSFGQVRLRRESGRKRRLIVQHRQRYRRTHRGPAAHSGRTQSDFVGHGFGRGPAFCRQSNFEQYFRLFHQLKRWHFDRGRRIAVPHGAAAGGVGSVSFRTIPVRGQREICRWYSAIP